MSRPLAYYIYQSLAYHDLLNDFDKLHRRILPNYYADIQWRIQYRMGLAYAPSLLLSPPPPLISGYATVTYCSNIPIHKNAKETSFHNRHCFAVCTRLDIIATHKISSRTYPNGEHSSKKKHCYMSINDRNSFVGPDVATVQFHDNQEHYCSSSGGSRRKHTMWNALVHKSFAHNIFISSWSATKHYFIWFGK